VIADVAVRLVAATLPAGVRERYREEWRADVAGAAEAGVPAHSVLGGALAVAIRVDRENPLVSGMTTRRLAFRRLRVALATAGVTLLLLLLNLWWSAWTGFDSRDLRALTDSSWLGRGLLAVAAVTAVVALVSGIGAFRAMRRGRVRRGWRASDTAVALTLPLALAATVLVPFVSVPLLLAFGLGLLVLVNVEDPRPQGRPLARGAAVLLASLAGGAILVTLAGTLLHVYVWNPLARMPGMTLDEIYAGLAAAGELPSSVVPISWAVLCGGVALALPVCAALPHPRIRRFMTARRLAGVGIAGVAVVAGGAWFVGFGMGMGMADAFATTGGDAAASGPVFTVIGIVFAIAALLVGLLPARIRSTSEMQEILPAPEP